MKQGSTWLIISLAVVLGVFVFWIDRTPMKTAAAKGESLYPDWDPAKIVTVDFYYTPDKWISAAKINGHWNLTTPIKYPANEAAIERIIASVKNLTTDGHISKEELEKNKRTIEEYGIKTDTQFQRLTLRGKNSMTEFHLGNKTVGEDEVFFKVTGKEEIYLAGAGFLDQIPKDENGWRDSHVFHPYRHQVEKISFKGPAPYGFELARNAVNPGRWDILSPTPSRADVEKVQELFNEFSQWNVEKYVGDDLSKKMLDYGLDTPQAQISFQYKDENDPAQKNTVIQFGNIDITHTNLAYIGLVTDMNTNVVLAQGEFLRNLMKPWQNFRCMKVWDVRTNDVQSVLFNSFPESIQGNNAFQLEKKEDTGTWVAMGLSEDTLSGMETYPADPKVVNLILQQLAETEIIEVTKEVVSDFSEYGLDKPFQRIVTTGTRGDQQQVDFGVVVTNEDPVEQKVYIRCRETGGSPLQNSVAEVSEKDAMKFPTEAFQLYLRDILKFSTNDFRKMTFRLGNRERVVSREKKRTKNVNGEKVDEFSYKIEGYDDTKEPIPDEVIFLMSELAYRLGELRADSWIYMGNEVPAEFEVKEAARSLLVEYKANGKNVEKEILFADIKVDRMPIGIVKMNGKMWVFKFPPATYEYYADLLGLLMGREGLGKK